MKKYSVKDENLNYIEIPTCFNQNGNYHNTKCFIVDIHTYTHPGEI